MMAALPLAEVWEENAAGVARGVGVRHYYAVFIPFSIASSVRFAGYAYKANKS
jgi:hypothetical protein